MTPEQQKSSTLALYNALAEFKYDGKGGQTALAKALSDRNKGAVSVQLVHSWLSTKVPINYVCAVEEILGIDRRVIRPDLIDIFGEKH